MNEAVKNALKLLVITLVAGLLLGVVYVITAEPIAEQEEKTRQEGFLAVFEDASSFETYEDYDAEELAEAVIEAGIDSSVAEITEVVEAKDAAGEHLGYIYSVNSKKGYGGNIEFLVGIQEDGTVNGYSILSISETAGLGMKAEDEEFYSQFEDKNVEYFEWTKDGAAADNEVDAISGATITTRAMTNGVNAAIYANDYLTEGEED